MTLPDEAEIIALCDRAGLPGPIRVTALSGGGNNKVFRIDGAKNQGLLKAYFRHPDDPRDRLGTEYSFCRFAWDAGVRCVPQPLARNDRLGWGLYQFVAGQPVRSADIMADHVRQAVDFFRELNRYKSSPEARQLKNASEACFTLDEHLQCVEMRVKRLDKIDRSTGAGEAAAKVIEMRLRPAWGMIRGKLSGDADASLPLAAEDRCLSPSDFGFHNSLESRGRLTFIDFEYAGWDDPAKTVCDFFGQPDTPVPMSFWDSVAAAFMAHTSDPAGHARRAGLLMNLYRVKWCCIMLNEFLPVDSRRRSFATDEQTMEARRQRQLEKVCGALEELRR